ncbi:hypothetical protein ACFLTW_05350 [Chloroflexota bacterium]
MIAAIGVFDGVHLGHRHLIAETVAQARQKGMLAGVVTFRFMPHQQLVVQSKLPFLTDLELRKKLLRKVGVDVTVALSFTEELVSLSAEEFIG